MADNTDEEHLDNPTNTQPENPSDEIIPTKDTQPINESQETENMEVHKHPHHVTHKKKWGEYLLEFFMLFLAVFLGFLAENIRENYVEEKREKEYAKSLYDDLAVDTLVIQRTIYEKNWISSKFDSAESILSSGDILKNNEFIYFVERYITLNDVFTAQDVTYQQLRSSGNFRYIRNVILYKNISDYYNLYSRYQAIDGNFGSINKNQLADVEARLFNPHDLTSLNNNNGNNFYNLVLPAGNKLAPIVDDKEMLKLLYIHVDNAKRRSTDAALFLTWLKRKATDIMKDIKKEYHLQNE